MGLTKRPDGYYVEMRVIDDGKTLRRATKEQGGKLKRWKVGGGNREAAHNYEAKLRAELNLGLLKSAQNSDLITFRVLCQRYLALPEIQRQALREWKQRMFNTRFLPRWADLPISAVTPAMLEQYREERRADGLAVATLNRHLALLKHVFSFAVREDWIEKSPARRVKLEKENNARDRVLSAPEFDALQAASPPHLQAVNLAAYYTGMRRGEILGLRWGRVDFKAGFIRLRAEDTKTNDGRIIPMMPELTALLRGLYKVRRLNEDRVFLLKGKPIRSIRTAFANACERAEIEGFRFHDFRHTCLSNLRLAGIDHLTMMKWSGHKTMDVFKRYQSFSEENLRESAKLLTRRLTLAQQPIEETIAK
jgi:integrase